MIHVICPTVTRCVFYIFSSQHLFFGWISVKGYDIIRGLIIKVKICVQSFIFYYQILFIYWTRTYTVYIRSTMQWNSMSNLVINLPLNPYLYIVLCQAMMEMKYAWYVSWKTELNCDFIKTTCRICKCLQHVQ